MNLTDAVNVVIDGKTVDTISIDGRLVYEQLTMTINADKEYIKPESTVNIQFNCERLPNKKIELFSVINMTRTSMGTETTDSNGKATWTYTGSGAGTVGFVAVYDEIESNTITVDDYTINRSSIINQDIFYDETFIQSQQRDSNYQNINFVN